VSVSVVLIDDQALIRTGFKMILESEDDIEVVGEANDGEQAISWARSVRPDVVLMDVQMLTMDGREATGRIARDASIPSRIVILTTFERDDYVFEALRAGASGFLLKNSPPEGLVHAVRVVAAGDALLAPSVTRKVIKGFIRRSAHFNCEVELGRLTERETEILQLLATGKSNSELAASLFVGEGTIKTHISNMLTKLGLRDQMQAVIFAYESGLIEAGKHRE
jgi:DNA-binding NarL/FixJ family response regulator